MRRGYTRYRSALPFGLGSVMAVFKFVVSCLIVLILPGSLMAIGDPELVDLGKLTLILSPAVAGLALNMGFGNRGERVQWRSVGGAALITLTVAGPAVVWRWR